MNGGESIRKRTVVTKKMFRFRDAFWHPFLYFLRPTSYPYQKRKEHNEIEQISKFHLHKNAIPPQTIIRAKGVPDCNPVISWDFTVLKIHSVYTFEKPSSKIYDSRDALVKLLIEKELITEAEFMQKLSAERAEYQAMMRKMS